jgi:hypothetical protein
MSFLIIDKKDGNLREEMRSKMMEQGFRNMGGNRSNYKDEETYEKAYCEGYKAGFEDAQKSMSGGGVEEGMRRGYSHHMG